MDVWDPANNSTKTSDTVECEVFLQNNIPKSKKKNHDISSLNAETPLAHV